MFVLSSRKEPECDVVLIPQTGGGSCPNSLVCVCCCLAVCLASCAAATLPRGGFVPPVWRDCDSLFSQPLISERRTPPDDSPCVEDAIRPFASQISGLRCQSETMAVFSWRRRRFLHIPAHAHAAIEMKRPCLFPRLWPGSLWFRCSAAPQP